MVISPSKALSIIESDRAKINRRFEQLRSVSQEMIELGFSDEEYEKVESKSSKSVRENKERLVLSLWSDTTGGKNVEESVSLIAILKTFEKGKHKPSEATIQSTRQQLIISFWYTAFRLPQDTLKILDDDKTKTNKSLDDLKHICKTLVDYGVTDGDYSREYVQGIRGRDAYGTVWYACCHNLDEAIDLVKCIEANYKPTSSWLKRLFGIKPKDENLKMMLNQLLRLYVNITNI